MNGPITDQVTSAFLQHKSAILAEKNEDFISAATLYKEAVLMFIELAQEESFARYVEKFVAVYSDNEDVKAELKNTFLQNLVNWSLDLHAGSFLNALSRRDVACARMHWELIKNFKGREKHAKHLAQSLYNKIDTIYLDDSEIESDYLKRRALIDSAELISKVIPEYMSARVKSVNAYASDFSWYRRNELKGDTVNRKKQKRSDGKIKKKQLKKTETLLPRHAKRMRRHLSVINKQGTKTERLDSINGSIELAVYNLGQGNDLECMKFLKQAMRSKPEDKELKQEIKNIKRSIVRRM